MLELQCLFIIGVLTMMVYWLLPEGKRNWAFAVPVIAVVGVTLFVVWNLLDIAWILHPGLAVGLVAFAVLAGIAIYRSSV